MDVSAALQADLAALSRALNDDADLRAQVQVLADDVKTAVSSYLGMTMTVMSGAHEMSFTIREGVDSHKITTSLRIALGSVSDPKAGSHLVLYAATPGAFVDLATDLSYALALDPTDLVLDAHLVAPSASSGVTGLAAHSVINQAVGVLIERGHTLQSADHELRRLAVVDEISLLATAQRLLATAARRLPTDDTNTP